MERALVQCNDSNVPFTLSMNNLASRNDPLSFGCFHQEVGSHLRDVNSTRNPRTFHSSRRVDGLLHGENSMCEIAVCEIVGLPQFLRRTSPNNWNRAFSPRRTPPVTGPECKPIRNDNVDVSGPYKRATIRLVLDRAPSSACVLPLLTSCTSSCLINPFILCMQSRANRAMTTA
jgi:hypothetical protein